MTKVPIYDVVIVGAGPVGLATAIGLQKRGLENILVIDKTREFRQVGQGFDLLPNGLKALKLIDPDAYDAVKQSGTLYLASPDQPSSPSPQWIYKNTQGEILRAVPLSFDHWFKTYGEGRVSIGWYTLQTTLRTLLSESQVQANCRCVNIVQESDTGYLRIDYQSNGQESPNIYAHWPESFTENSSTEPTSIQSIRAKFVVAADGINSTVRRLIYPDNPPLYSGYGLIGCTGTEQIPDALAQTIYEKFIGQLPLVSIFNQHSTQGINNNKSRLILAKRPNHQFAYIMHHCFSVEELTQQSKPQIIDRTIHILTQEEFPDELLELVRLSPADSMVARPYYIYPVTADLSFPETADPQLQKGRIPKLPWHREKIVLAGDSAHGMPPFAGQGANQGLEDAWCLSRGISQLFEQGYEEDLEKINEVFDEYEKTRYPIMAQVQQATLRGLYQTDQEWQDYNQRIHGRSLS
ncbi:MULTISPECIES: NAD(P)/FAD-dependent oxidoreductase [unclassified Roseofilum]|uniref:FAD-dependent oxidoreductase n=1 Tax=unclassified Roseofilum TaxID=2620099 RepID=UPI000E9B32B2|nr:MULTISPECIES: NAD(P)/FAD-dependent oxidoreductase [unclassified Roseofilum]MBP0007219.1 FAD-dependent monooxygenase [Roseofilum sp. Belize Diploria]MBP0031862.1 FAD-dependent monooxygenase [Roseofilum sp. Belize BBD 4]HBQ97547.1 FAD-dependent monooxygenase [Cyanobacteria bacterium UBA11691]